MGRLTIRQHPHLDQIEQERRQRFMKLSTMEKLNELFALIDLSVKLNGGKPLKEPQGLGLVIKKPRNGHSE